MTWSTWRGVLGVSSAALLLFAPAAVTWAQTSPTTHPGVAKPAAEHAATATKAKLKVVTAARHEPAHPVQKLAAAKPKPAVKHAVVAAKKKPAPAKKIEIAKKAEAAKVASVAAKPVPPSYTITTVHDGVIQTTTRIVPLPTAAPAPVAVAAAPPAAQPEAKVTTAAPVTQIASAAPTVPVETKPAEIKPAVASGETKAAAIPVSLTEAAAPAKPASYAAIAATSLATPSEKQPAPAVATQPTDRKEAGAFVSHFLSEAFSIAKSDGTSLQRRAKLAELFAAHMDVKRIAGYTTADELSDASSDIQQRFRTILVSYLVETYYPQLELASDPSVTVDTTPIDPLPDGTAVVWTTFTKGGWGSQSVKWHLVNENGHYRIVDIFSAGASLVQMERDTFLSVMRKGGLNELMTKLDARTKELASAATE